MGLPGAPLVCGAARYERHRPETTALRELVRDNLETLYGAIADGALDVRLPKHAKKELEAYLHCGLLCRGFARLRCGSCNGSRLVAFSWGDRVPCPSGRGAMPLGLEQGAVFAGRYRVERLLATGAMGAVYEAVHLGTQRRRALKVMHPHVLERPELRERFELEARVTAGVASDFVVEVSDAGIDDAAGTPFLVMELLQGEELGKRLKRVGRFPADETLAYLHQIALALDATHRASIVHRDLKPSNVFLTERSGRAPRVKVLDFGIAKIIAESTGGSATMTVGTPYYMAPEQFKGEKVSPATDLYALGMMAYTLLTGEAYWADEKSQSENLVAFALVAVAGPNELASVRAARNGVALPPEFDAWFAQATAIRPARRFARATEAIEALANVFGLSLPTTDETQAPAADTGVGSAPVSATTTAGSSRARTLRDYAGEPAVPLGRRLRWLVDLARALAAAHRSGRVHGKLTPEGVLVRIDGSLRVPGLEASLAGDDTVAEPERDGTDTGTGMGAHAYLAPEQLRGEPADGRSDQFAWGLIARELLAGAHDVPGEVEEAARRALEDRPEDRHATLEDAIQAIEPFAESAGRVVESAEPTAALEAEATKEGSSEVDPLAPTRTLPAGTPASGEAPPRAPGPRVAARLAALGGVLVMGIAVALFASWAKPVPPPPPPPLSSPASKLACPILAASGVDEPAGWLGAAAAATLCERARLILGGEAERTLMPAQLLDLPREPRDDFPVDPYATPEARTRSIEAARQRAAAYVDGEVAKDGSRFRVTLAFHRADGAELARASGAGRALYQAVREAMTPLVRSDLLPMASALDPEVADWSRARDVPSALALLDVTLAMAQNAGGLAEECAALDEKSAGLGEMGPGERWLCAYTLGSPPTELPLFSMDPASPAAYVARARLNHRTDRSRDREVAATLDTLFWREPSNLGRSTIASTESCLLQSSDPKRAYEVAFMAVQADPKNPMGDLCPPWGQLVTMAQDTPSAKSAVRAMHAWVPWDSTGWSAPALSGADDDRAFAYAQRAYALTPFDTTVANTLADLLLGRGTPADVQNIALAMRAGGHPVHVLDSELLLMRFDASRAHFRDALARARPAMEIPGAESGWVQVLRFEVGWRAVEIAAVLGRAPEIADLVVERFLDPEPPPLNAVETAVTAHIPAVCARASREVGRRCFARFEALRGRLSRGPETDAFTRGAERYAVGDLHAAADAWRPLLAEPGIFASVLPDAMAAAFDRTGDVELVDKLVAGAKETAMELGGATPVMVLEARRADKRGDRARALGWTKRVIQAWQVADEVPPAVEEMKRLRDRLE